MYSNLVYLFYDNFQWSKGIKIGARYHRKEVVEDHISVLAEPGSTYSTYSRKNVLRLQRY